MTTTRTREDRQVGPLTVSEWAGQGPAVVALAGLGGSGRTWSALAERLGDRHVVGPHLRGRGGSEHAGGPTGLRAHARDVAQVLAELDLTDVVVVGHSMGAFLAPVVVQEAGGRVARLVLVDGGVPPELPFFMGPRLTRFAFGKDLAKVLRPWASAEELVDTLGRKMLRDRPDLRGQLVTLLAGDLVGEPGRLRVALDGERAKADAVDCFFGDTTSAVEALDVPAHLVAAEHGKHDTSRPFLSQSVVDTWTARLPLLTAERVPGNHATVLFSDEVAAAVRG